MRSIVLDPESGVSRAPRKPRAQTKNPNLKAVWVVRMKQTRQTALAFVPILTRFRNVSGLK